ncbi:serine/threonine-protein kinase [Aerosakkonema funiforme]|uniref:non-specific serine/threonine protein kinase n=3 Tax=Oscillatoriophycideae TaxID=1301283 RepID=A0A926VIX9_9CYAN|nr:serine/threonine-protein kinase [Aerosakkonema funiforme]MBD2184756.1 serine/threonine protein kinase [Aerosakkonema funiforme FACHB-1375]
MSYCLNPDTKDCQKPENPDNTRFCQSCGSKLRLKDRYRAIKVLGKGGFGKTFLAVDEHNGDKCVIKQLLVPPEVQNNPAQLQTYIRLFEREAKQLAELGIHPQIPTLFDYLEQGLEKANQSAYLQSQKYLYLIQEFIEGQDLLEELTQQGAFNEKQIREFLKELLPVLKFIHDKNVIHRDIKPQNIMRRKSDRQLVLIDFGIAKEFTTTYSGQAGTTVSVLVGTPGYAPKEQVQYGKVYPATDLYSLAASCIHLLTRIPPHNLYDPQQDYWIWRQHLAKPISSHLGQILDKLLKESVRERYQSADEVIKEFIPEVRLSQSSLTFTATKINQILTQTIKITNSIPDTLLEGRWEVAPHPNDPPHTPNTHAWISFSPAQFASDQIDCKITVDTSKLQADQAGERQILLHTNSSPNTYILTVKVQTAPLPIANKQLPYGSLSVLFVTCFGVAWVGALAWGMPGAAFGAGIGALIGVFAGAVTEASIDGGLGFGLGALAGYSTKSGKGSSVVELVVGMMAGSVAGSICGLIGSSLALAKGDVPFFMALVWIVVVSVVGFIAGLVARTIAKNLVTEWFVVVISILTVGLGISLGIGFIVGFLNLLIILALAGTGLPLATMIFYPILRRRRLIVKYQQSQQHLIKP